MIISVLDESNISAVINILLLLYNQSLKLFSKKILRIFRFLLTISRVILGKYYKKFFWLYFCIIYSIFIYNIYFIYVI